MAFFRRVLQSTRYTLVPVAKKLANRNTNWKRPKHAEKRLPAPDSLEQRQTVSDTFFVALQAAGASLLGNIAAEKARDPFGLTNTLDMSVSGESEQIRAAANRGASQAPQSVVRLADGPASNGTRASGTGRVARDNSASSRLAEWKTDDDLASARDDTLPEVVDSSAIRDVAPPPHGVIRKLKLAPPAFAVGASTTFVADAAPTSQARAAFEIPEPAEPPAAAEPVPAAPPRPNMPVGAGGKADSNVSAASAAESGGAVSSGSTALSKSPLTPTLSPRGGGRGQGEGGVASSERGTPSVSDEQGSSSLLMTSGGTSTAAGETVSLQNGGDSTVFSPGSQCVQTPPNQSGGGPPVVPPGPPCTPPGQQTSSPPDPLYVLNWESNHGLVAFPGMVEYDTDGQWIELRGQVNGATVSSWGVLLAEIMSENRS